MGKRSLLVHQGERAQYLTTDRIRIAETEQVALAFSFSQQVHPKTCQHNIRKNLDLQDTVVSNSNCLLKYGGKKYSEQSTSHSRKTYNDAHIHVYKEAIAIFRGYKKD